jgi:uncharacterized DUF497 family protein
MAIEFTWNPKKAESNLAKHGVSFDDAITVFADPLARIFEDEEHAVEERRELIIGRSAEQHLLIVSFVARNETVRILSVRKVTRKERKDYEEDIDN